MPILSATLPVKPFDTARHLQWVHENGYRNRVRQVLDIARLGRKDRFTARDYFQHGFFLSDDPIAAARTYVSETRGNALSLRLAPLGLSGLHGMLRDKPLSSLVVRNLGFATSTDLAVFHPVRKHPGVAVLRTASDLRTFLEAGANYPCFGKPLDASRSVGCISMTDVSGGEISLADGRIVQADALAREIHDSFPGGYLFQRSVVPHPQVTPVTGQTTSTLRIVTLRLKAGFDCLYVVQKIAAKGAMFDGYAGKGSNAMCHVDPATGVILRAQMMDQMSLSALQASPHTGQALERYQLPYVAQAVSLCKDIHAHLPYHGILGFDIFITENGPVFRELGSLPIHNIYQRAAAQGLLAGRNADLLHEAETETKRLQSH
jgi:Sugar-transfer associated ATP-grasp